MQPPIAAPRALLKLILLAPAASLPGALAASPDCALTGFAAHYQEVYERRGLLSDCYHRLIDTLDKARLAQARATRAWAAGRQLAGYKIGLTDRRVQERFGVDRPLVGVLFEDMLLDDGAVVARASGAALQVEADLLVRVKSADINQARSVAEAARHIDAALPFIELPDIQFRLNAGNTAALLLASNVGARWGAQGAPLSVASPQELVECLPRMTVTLATGSGDILRQGRGDQILGHPLRAVLRLLDELALRKETLKPGQLLSLGGIGGPVKAQPGQRYAAAYSGCGATPGVVSVSVR